MSSAFTSISTMARLETATFDALTLRASGKFESIQGCPILLAYSGSTPFGVEVDSRFSPLPVFAGGNDPRKHLVVQIEISEEEAAGLRRLDDACHAASTATGTWTPLVTLREGRQFIKTRLLVEHERPSAVRVGGEDLAPGWGQLGPALQLHRELRGAKVKAALRPMYVWSVSGKRGLTLGIEQLVAEPAAPNTTLDYFM
jgi:hypothetical protein